MSEQNKIMNVGNEAAGVFFCINMRSIQKVLGLGVHDIREGLENLHLLAMAFSCPDISTISNGSNFTAN